MSSRALSLATVLLLIGFGATDTVLAQATNLEAGKAPSQLFAQTCNACHKSPRGLLKTVAPGSLPGFLRQHYTTSSDMAGVLASYSSPTVPPTPATRPRTARTRRTAPRRRKPIQSPAVAERQGAANAPRTPPSRTARVPPRRGRTSEARRAAAPRKERRKARSPRARPHPRTQRLSVSAASRD